MAKYIPPTIDWVREQVELYEGSGGTKGTTLRDTGLPCIIVTNQGNKTGAVRKIPLMRVKVGNGYVLVGSMGGQPKNPVWVYNLRANPDTTVQIGSRHLPVHARVANKTERKRLWPKAVAAYGGFEDYQRRTEREIPLVILEPR